MELEMRLPGGRRPRASAGDGTLRVLLLGDWSGRGGIGLETPLASRPFVRLAAEAFDDALAAVAPRLAVEVAEPFGQLEPRRLEDFHPDELLRQLPLFAGLREVRRRLLDPTTFAETAAALEGGRAVPVAATAKEDDGDTLARLLGGARAPAQPGGLGQFLRDVVAPHVVPDVSARQTPLVAAIDQATAQHLRAVLRDPGFRRLEARWRAAQRLVASIESPDAAVFLLDVARPELGLQLAALTRRLAGDPWSLLVLDDSFGPGADDVALLSALGGMAAALGAPLLAAADPALLGCRSLAATPHPADWPALSPEEAARWQTLRHSPPAAWLALAAPRWLQRLPYGPATDPVESFAFDELADGRSHEHYLWGNPAFACAQLIAAAFAASGSALQPGEVSELDDLPGHVYREGGEARLQPVAETFLSDRAVQAIADRGLIPLVSARDRNALRIPRFQSLADGTPLAVEV
jgi:type VI secretion system protein ImpC